MARAFLTSGMRPSQRLQILDRNRGPALPEPGRNGRYGEAFGNKRRSEVRLVRSRNLRVLFGVVFMRVFGADRFGPFAQRAQWAPISYGCRPGHREDAVILDRELELQPLALVIGVGCKAWISYLEVLRTHQSGDRMAP
jgi:hypothetical protein